VKCEGKVEEVEEQKRGGGGTEELSGKMARLSEK
jgi:hypothetical protein